MLPSQKEKTIECRVLCPVYHGADGKYYRKGATIVVPESWVAKGTTHEAGHPEIIIDRPLKPLSEEQAELEQQINAPKDNAVFDAEVKKREAWSAVSQSAEDMIRKDQDESTKRAMIAAGMSIAADKAEKK